jgi:hypothetical protein
LFKKNPMMKGKGIGLENLVIFYPVAAAEVEAGV